MFIGRALNLMSKYKFYRLQHLLYKKINSPIVQVRSMSVQWSNPQEIQIPVSYGFIAAKVWGEKNAEPVLALHGWQDNAGTFDRLIPLLSSKLYIVAIDSPGHGLSSHKPCGTFYHYMELLVDIKRVIDHLKWDKFSIIGHSLGGTLALMYSSLFPENIKNVVLLDIVKPGSRSTEKLPDIAREGVVNLLDIERKMSNPTPVYSPEEAHRRLIKGLYNEITAESADVLLKRGCQPSNCGKGVIFSRDIRVKMTEDLHKLSHDDLKAFMGRVKCNLLLVLGESSIIFRSRTPEVLSDFLNLYKQNCKSFQVVQVEGNHFVHLNDPDHVAPHIDNFFKTYSNEVSKI